MLTEQSNPAALIESNLKLLGTSLLPTMLAYGSLNRELNNHVDHVKRVQEWQTKLQDEFPFLTQNDNHKFHAEGGCSDFHTEYPERVIVNRGDFWIFETSEGQEEKTNVFRMRYNWKSQPEFNIHEGITIIKHLHPETYNWSDSAYPEKWSEPINPHSPEFKKVTGITLYTSLPSLTDKYEDLHIRTLFNAYKSQRTVKN